MDGRVFVVVHLYESSVQVMNDIVVSVLIVIVLFARAASA